MKRKNIDYSKELAKVMPRNNGTQSGINALQTSLDRNKKPMTLSLEQLVNMLAKCNDLFDVYYSVGMYSRAKRYADIGDRLIKAIFRPSNKFM